MVSLAFFLSGKVVNNVDSFFFIQNHLNGKLEEETYIDAALIRATYEMHRRDHQTIHTPAGELNRANQLKVAQRPDLAQRGRNVERKEY